MKNSKKIFYNLDKMPLPEFLELVSKGELLVSEYNLDIWDYLHTKTVHFKKERVEEIKQHIDIRIFQNIKSSLEKNPDHVRIVIDSRKKEGKEVPYNGLSSLINMLKGTPALYKEAIKNSEKINIDKLTELIIKEGTYYGFLLFNVGFLNLSRVKNILLSSGKARFNSPADQNKEPEFLFDIWQPGNKGSKDQYKIILEKLKLFCPDIDKPFVTEINGKLFWHKGPGSIQYLKGFIWICIDKKWITDTYSAPQYKIVLSNTFNIDFSNTPFKQLYATPPEKKYLKPFENLPANI